MSSDFYSDFIVPQAGIIIKICRAYTDSQQDFEDYYQEVCLQIWKSRDKFAGHSEWSTWVYRIALNVCLSQLRNENKHQNQVEISASNVYLSEANTAFNNEALNLLYAAIKKLSEVDRAVILFYLEEKPNTEIAAIIGTTPNNIGVKINRIKNRLKELLDGKIN